MQRTYVVTRSGNLKAIYKHARLTCSPEIKKAMDGALDEVVIAAAARAPVYDQAKWSQWYMYEHHYNPPPGTLAASVFHSKTRGSKGGVEYKAVYGSKLYYAKYIEDGFRHKKARYGRSRKFVVGKHFMESSLDLVFPPTVHLKLRKAVENMLMAPAVGV